MWVGTQLVEALAPLFGPMCIGGVRDECCEMEEAKAVHGFRLVNVGSCVDEDC